MLDAAKTAEGDAVLAAERDLFLTREALADAEASYARLSTPLSSWLMIASSVFMIAFASANIVGIEWLHLAGIPGYILLVTGLTLAIRRTRASRRVLRASVARLEATKRHTDAFTS